MMIFRLEPNFAHQPTKQEIEMQQQSWGTWIGNLANSGKMIETNRFDFKGKIVDANKNVSENYYAPENKMVSGYMIVKVATENEVVEMAKECPIALLSGFVEIREIVAM